MLDLLVKSRDQQQAIGREIVECEDARDSRGRLPRSKRMRVGNLARDERDVIRDTTTVRESLVKEQAQVYAFVVDDILGDMEQIRESLTAEETGSFTQLLAEEVVQKMNNLLEALNDDRDNRRRQQAGGAAQTRLIPPVAEANMLKRMQEEINAQTQALERARQVNKNELNETMIRRLNRLALRQGSLATLTKKVARDFFGLVPEEKKRGQEGEGDGNTKD